MSAYLHSIQVNPEGGVPKYRVDSAFISSLGVEGDKQNNVKNHGGILKAVCLYSLEVITSLQEQGHPIHCGTTGENLTVAGLEWGKVQAGTILNIGDVQLEITMPASPCYKIADSFLEGDYSCISHDVDQGMSRMYGKVITEGTLKPGDVISLQESA